MEHAMVAAAPTTNVGQPSTAGPDGHSVEAWLNFKAAQSVPAYELPGRFGALHSCLCIVHVFARLDVCSLTRLLSTCMSLREEFLVHDVEEQTAWRLLVDEELLQQVAVLGACERDMRAVLDAGLRKWLPEALAVDGENAHVLYVQVWSAFDERENERAGGTCEAPSALELLKPSQKRQRHQGDARQWFIHRAQKAIEDALDHLLEHGPPLTTPADVDMAVHAFLTFLNTYTELARDIQDRREAAQDLADRLGNFNDARMFRTMIVRPAARGQLAHIDELLEQRAKELRVEKEAKAKGGVTARGSKAKRQKTGCLDASRVQEEKSRRWDERAAWARGRLQWMRAWSIARERRRGQRLPRLWAQVVMLSQEGDGEGMDVDGERMVPGEWTVDEEGRVQLLCYVPAHVSTETSVKNCGEHPCQLDIHFASYSSATSEPEEDAEPPRLHLPPGATDVCKFSGGERESRLGGDAVKDVWYIDALEAGDSARCGLLVITIRPRLA